MTTAVIAVEVLKKQRPEQVFCSGPCEWCGRTDSNRHAFRHTPLNRFGAFSVTQQLQPSTNHNKGLGMDCVGSEFADSRPLNIEKFPSWYLKGSPGQQPASPARECESQRHCSAQNLDSKWGGV